MASVVLKAQMCLVAYTFVFTRTEACQRSRDVGGGGGGGSNV